MTVLTAKQARTAAPSAFGLGEIAPRCELCREPWRAGQAQRTPYGPFVVWCCWPCSVRMAKGARQRRTEARGVRPMGQGA